MKSTYKLSLFLVAAGLLFVAGCSSTPISFPALNAKDIDLDRARTIHGSACGFQLLLMVPININSRLGSAYDQLMEEAGKDLVANIKIDESWYYAYVGTVYCTHLTATAYSRIKKETPIASNVTDLQH